MSQETPDVPVFVCRRVHRRQGDQFTFECPYCWTYGSAFGAGDIDSTGSYTRRPKRAKAVWHAHGSANGPRGAHCFEGSPLLKTGYVLRESHDLPTE